MKIVTIIGARPQFIKAAAISRAIAAHNLLTPHSSCLTEVIIHTGQHYNDDMSAIFFRELEIPEPNYNLNIGSGSHGAQTGRMLIAIEDVLLKEKPDWVLIYGDTNSTLAGALAAAKLHIRIAHVEAGMRSYNRLMPEEINRIVADQLSHLLFCPSQVAVNNLVAEGITSPLTPSSLVTLADNETQTSETKCTAACRTNYTPGQNEQRAARSVSGTIPEAKRRGTHLTPHVILSGDVMADALKFAAAKTSANSDILARLGLQPQGYLLATVHRAENTNDPDRLGNIMRAFSELAESEVVILPLHPRTKKILEDTFPSHHTPDSPRLKILDPVGYFDIIALEKSARIIITDSGGMQKEAYWFKVPCITLRDETEWVETVESGWNILTGADRDRIIETVRSLKVPTAHPPLYGDGKAAEKIIITISGEVV